MIGVTIACFSALGKIPLIIEPFTISKIKWHRESKQDDIIFMGTESLTKYFLFISLNCFFKTLPLVHLPETALLNCQFYLRAHAGKYTFSEHLPDMGE